MLERSEVPQGRSRNLPECTSKKERERETSENERKWVITGPPQRLGDVLSHLRVSHGAAT